MKKINLLLGGPTDLWPDEMNNMDIDGEWIGVDRGNLWLIEKGKDPVIAIGDFDSMSSDEQKIVSSHVIDIRTFDPHKDYTDTQLALTIADQELNADIINIYGATGGRIDHFISNFLMATEPKYKSIVPKLRIIDKQNTITYYTPGDGKVIKEANKHYLAFIPLNKMNLSIYDAEYTLDNHFVPRAFAYSSNQFVTDECNFWFDEGILCVIQSKDEK